MLLITKLSKLEQKSIKKKKANEYGESEREKKVEATVQKHGGARYIRTMAG